MNLFRKYFQYLLEKQEKFFVSRCTTSIHDTTMFAWKKAQEGKVKFLKKKRFVPVFYLNKAKRMIENEYIETFGLDKGFKNYLDLICEIQLLKNKMAITGDKSLQMFIDIKQIELEELNSTQSSNNFDETTVLIEKFMQFKINLKETTVFEYYNYLNSLKKSAQNG